MRTIGTLLAVKKSGKFVIACVDEDVRSSEQRNSRSDGQPCIHLETDAPYRAGNWGKPRAGNGIFGERLYIGVLLLLVLRYIFNVPKGLGAHI